MARPLTIVALELARALIARRWLGESRQTDAHGAIVLRPHQGTALERLRLMLREHRGALLADDVGLGKTYVAAALARDYERVLVVAPATLRTMWIDALRAADAKGIVMSYDTLSRSGGPDGPFDLVLLDEAHHVRTPTTRRYARIAALADGAHLLLLSATPIHNSRVDLAALLALFLGASALALDDDALARHVVRRERADVPLERLPETTAPEWLTVGDDEELLRAIVALPPPVPPRDGGAAGALLAWGLVREWASSNAALVGALRRRLVRAGAIDSALTGGHLPTRHELAAWACGDGAVQLAFPELIDAPAASDPARLRSVLARHERAVQALLERARGSAWTDARRAELLREIREQHRGEKIVAFTQFADTARGLFRELRRDTGVAVLTARGASVAGGALSRREAIERFAPRASGVRPPRVIERIELLIATDLLSEGVNLHDASVVVHLDLPWTAARMEQRVGRSRRLGALHARTTVYALQPPASSEALLRVEERLRAKLRAASRMLGAADCVLPALAGDAHQGGRHVRSPGAGGDASQESAARRRELIVRELERWRGGGGDDAVDPVAPQVSGAIAAVSRARSSAVLALVRENGEYYLVAALGEGEVTDDPAIVLEVVRLATVATAAPGSGAPRAAALRDHALAAAERVDSWVAHRAALLAAGSVPGLDTPARKRALRRVATIAARAPRHRRAEVARLATVARQAAASPYGAGAERLLEDLAAAEMASGEAWLRALGEFAAARGSAAGAGGGGRGEAPGSVPLVEPVALLVLTGP